MYLAQVDLQHNTTIRIYTVCLDTNIKIRLAGINPCAGFHDEY